MKKIYLSLLVVATAVGMSSFVNAPKKAKFSTNFYQLNEAGTVYTNVGTSDPSALCESKPTNQSCVISYPDDSHGATIDATVTLPSGSTPSGGNGYIPE